MNFSRRDLLKNIPLGAGASLLGPMAQRILANSEGKTSSPRFVFVLQSNGFDAVQACPDSIPHLKYEDREKFESTDLTQHKLPKGLAPLEPLKSKTTIIQGLSGRCTGGGHSIHGGALDNTARPGKHFHKESPLITNSANSSLESCLGSALAWLPVHGRP